MVHLKETSFTHSDILSLKILWASESHSYNFWFKFFKSEEIRVYSKIILTICLILRPCFLVCYNFHVKPVFSIFLPMTYCINKLFLVSVVARCFCIKYKIKKTQYKFLWIISYSRTYLKRNFYMLGMKCIAFCFKSFCSFKESRLTAI